MKKRTVLEEHIVDEYGQKVVRIITFQTNGWNKIQDYYEDGTVEEYYEKGE